jgi:hypothetical protein
MGSGGTISSPEREDKAEEAERVGEAKPRQQAVVQQDTERESDFFDVKSDYYVQSE